MLSPRGPGLGTEKHLIVSVSEVFQKVSLRCPSSADNGLWVRYVLMLLKRGSRQGGALARDPGGLDAGSGLS